MTVADYILKFLISKNVNNVFLMTGGAISFIVDSFSRKRTIKMKSAWAEYYAGPGQLTGHEKEGPRP